MFKNTDKVKTILNDSSFTGFKDLLFPSSFDWINNEEVTCEYLTKNIKGVGKYEERFNFIKSAIDNKVIGRASVYSLDEVNKDKSKERVETLYYLNKDSNKIAIILPGGGYSCVCSYCEGWPVAEELYKRGFNCFILYYRVFPDCQMPKPIEDLARLIRFIKDSFLELDLNNYLLMGFSAGGHLAGIWPTKEGNKKYLLPSPKYLVLGYPVTDLSLKCSTRINCKIGEESDFISNFSPALNVELDYPKTYMWQGEFDDVIPFEHSVRMNKVLTLKNVEHKYVTYMDTCHGFNVGVNTIAEGWLDKMLEYFNLI